MKWEMIGFIGVDSGQVMITDPCYLKSEPFDYDKICEITLGPGHGVLNYGMGHGGLAVVSETTHGDGCYEVYGLMDDNDRPHAMMVVTSEFAKKFLGLTEEE